MQKRFDVYGIGNALVDMEYTTTDDELKALGVEKGVMTLIEEKRQAELLEKLWRAPKKRACGGSAANTLIGLVQFGGKAFYSCRVADDETGNFYFQDLLESGVQSNLTHQRHPNGVTGKCLVLVTPDAERTLNTYLGVTAELSSAELDENALKDSRWVYIEGYLAPSPTARVAARKAVELAQANKIPVAITLSDPNMVKFFEKELTAIMAPRVELLFCNENEALLLTQKSDVRQAADALKARARSFAITRGAKGALIFDGYREITVPAVPVKPVDTNGAGDIFAGAFLYGITHGWDFEKSGRFANLAAGRLVEHFGPRLTRPKAQQVLGEFLQ